MASAAPTVPDLADALEEFGWQADQYECYVDYLGEFSKANGLHDLWKRYGPEMKRLVASWQACSKLQGQSKKFL